MDDMLKVSGRLTVKDLKRLTAASRNGTVGPTVVYYAGLTAPIIGAGMSLLTSKAFALTGMTEYWQFMLSAIIAAMAGISWYLIFTRLAYRRGHGRSGEIAYETSIEIRPDILSIKRGPVETQIAWSDAQNLTEKRKHLMIDFASADPILIPDTWFGGDRTAKSAFVKAIKGKLANGA